MKILVLHNNNVPFFLCSNETYELKGDINIFITVHVGHPNIGQNQIKMLMPQFLQSLNPVMCRDDIFETVLFAQGGQNPEVHIKVINKQ